MFTTAARPSVPSEPQQDDSQQAAGAVSLSSHAAANTHAPKLTFRARLMAEEPQMELALV